MRNRKRGYLRIEVIMEHQTCSITISRQMGSGGTVIGRNVARDLGFSYVDREILHQAADLLKEDESSVEAYEEKSFTFVERLMRVFSLGSPEILYIPKEPPTYDRNLFVVEGRIIREMANRDDTVIMGRGGFAVLKGRPKTLHILIHANKNYRVERVMAAEGIADQREAIARVEESDQKRTKFVKDMVGVDWMDARNYHLCINTSVIDLEETVSTIVHFVKASLF
jgi:cytidylate kinase